MGVREVSIEILPYKSVGLGRFLNPKPLNPKP